MLLRSLVVLYGADTLKPYKHQEELSTQALDILRENMMVYLAMEERTGKTLTALLVAEKSTAKRVLVITKKKALDGWEDTLAKFTHTKDYVVTNYHQAHKVEDDFDLVLLDESHNYISSFPKPSSMWKKLKLLLARTPIVYISATPYAQGLQMLFHQFQLSSWSPWRKHKNFYQWFRLYGKPYELEVAGMKIRQYDRCHEDMILSVVEHLFITKTRKELGFEHEPEDVKHYVELSKETKKLYNDLVTDELAPVEDRMLVCDTKSKLRVSLHMLEGGVAKIDEEYLVLANQEKIDYVLHEFGDNSTNVIMYNYKAERTKLERHFKQSLLLQATSYAEGVDLSNFDNLIVYSQDFSTARHTQRRARQCNIQRKDPIRVHFMLVKGGLSEQVFKTVTINKTNFVDSVYYKETL